MYKRQSLNSVEKIRITLSKRGKKEAGFTLIWMCITAVSYTHLDVYKRQYPESVHGIQAGLRMMVLEMYPVTRRITVFVYSRQENNITVTCRHLIISGQDILSENF